MRLFVAVKAPGQLLADVDAQLDALRRNLPLVWTRPQSWHLTLQFLGEWPGDLVKPLQDSLQDIAAGEPFVLHPAGSGWFPRRGAPRVFFLQLEGGPQIRSLAEEVRRAVARVWPDGPQDTRGFRPHLTLARIKQPLAAGQIQQLRAHRWTDLPSWPVAGFSLMSSRLRPQGAEYRELARFHLRK